MPPPRTRKRTLNNITNLSGAALQALTQSVTNEIRSGLGDGQLTEETARQLVEGLIAKKRSETEAGENENDGEEPQPKKKKKGRKPLPTGAGVLQVSRQIGAVIRVFGR